MPIRFRINALLILILAVLFYFFFMASKHDPTLSAVNPFAEDPYDAIGSFGIQAAAILGLLSLLRAYWLYRGSAQSDRRQVYLARTQMLAVLAVGVTLAGDLLGMARSPSLWLNTPGGNELAALLVGLLLLVIAAGALIYRSVREVRLPVLPHVWRRTWMVAAAAAVLLAVYPDALRQSTPGALFTVMVGVVLLFVPMRALGMSLLPYQTEAVRSEPVKMSEWIQQNKYPLGFVILFGVGMGSMLVLAETAVEGGSSDVLKLAFVAAVYIGLETCGLIIGYGLLRKPLGLFLREPQPIQD